MTPLLESLMQSLRDPVARHAMLVHAPIALGALGIVPVLALVLTGCRSTALKLVCIGWFLVAAAGALAAERAGHDAEHAVKAAANPSLSSAEKGAIHDHEELAENGWLWPLIPACLIGISFARAPAVRATAGGLALVAAGGVAIWIGVVGHAGGRLVWVHGLAAPPRSVGVEAAGGSAAGTAENKAPTAAPQPVEVKHDH